MVASAQSTKRILPWLVAVAFFMEMLDTTILNTALPDDRESARRRAARDEIGPQLATR